MTQLPPYQRLYCKNSLTQDLEYFVNRSIVFEFPFDRFLLRGPRGIGVRSQGSALSWRQSLGARRLVTGHRDDAACRKGDAVRLQI